MQQMSAGQLWGQRHFILFCEFTCFYILRCCNKHWTICECRTFLCWL